MRACDVDCDGVSGGEPRDLWSTEDLSEYGLLEDASGLGRLWAGIGECELVKDDCARMSSTASSSNRTAVCASMSALLGSTRNNVCCKFDRSRWAYDRKRARRSSPPHVVVIAGLREPESRTRGGYAAAPDVGFLWFIGGEIGAVLYERDSSSWK